MKDIYLGIGILAVLFLIVIANIALRRTAVPAVSTPVATSTVSTTTVIIPPAPATTTVVVVTPTTPGPTRPTQSGNNYTIALNQKLILNIDEFSLRALTVTEDSRCPSDVECVWAGRVGVNVKIGTNTHVFNEGTVVKSGQYTVTLKSVTPYPTSTKKIEAKDYRFTFTIIRENKVTSGACYVGGCSAQLCSDRKDVASTCEYRPVYACYKQAKCERQENGFCDWTPNEAFASCVRQNEAGDL